MIELTNRWFLADKKVYKVIKWRSGSGRKEIWWCRYKGEGEDDYQDDGEGGEGESNWHIESKSRPYIERHLPE